MVEIRRPIGRAATPTRPGLFVKDHLDKVGEDYIGSIHRSYKQTFIRLGLLTKKKGPMRPPKPYRLCSYHSFNAFFAVLIRLGLVEFSREERITPGEVPQFSGGKWAQVLRKDLPVRRFYRLSDAGRIEPVDTWLNAKAAYRGIIIPRVPPTPPVAPPPSPPVRRRIGEVIEAKVAELLPTIEAVTLSPEGLELLEAIEERVMGLADEIREAMPQVKAIEQEKLENRMALVIDIITYLPTAKELLQAILEMTEAQRAGTRGRRAFAQLTRLMADIRRACAPVA